MAVALIYPEPAESGPRAKGKPRPSGTGTGPGLAVQQGHISKQRLSLARSVLRFLTRSGAAYRDARSGPLAHESG
jgi:hypothetical protein